MPYCNSKIVNNTDEINKQKKVNNKIECTILYIEDNIITVQDKNNISYIFSEDKVKFTVGTNIIL